MLVGGGRRLLQTEAVGGSAEPVPSQTAKRISGPNHGGAIVTALQSAAMSLARAPLLVVVVLIAGWAAMPLASSSTAGSRAHAKRSGGGGLQASSRAHFVADAEAESAARGGCLRAMLRGTERGERHNYQRARARLRRSFRFRFVVMSLWMVLVRL